jgi:hypothetical protein
MTNQHQKKHCGRRPDHCLGQSDEPGISDGPNCEEPRGLNKRHNQAAPCFRVLDNPAIKPLVHRPSSQAAAHSPSRNPSEEVDRTLLEAGQRSIDRAGGAGLTCYTSNGLPKWTFFAGLRVRPDWQPRGYSLSRSVLLEVGAVVSASKSSPTPMATVRLAV